MYSKRFQRFPENFFPKFNKIFQQFNEFNKSKAICQLSLKNLLTKHWVCLFWTKEFLLKFFTIPQIFLKQNSTNFDCKHIKVLQSDLMIT